MDKTSNEMLAYRDIQEIKLSLKHFTGDVTNQLQLLMEIIKHDTSDKKDARKDIEKIEKTIDNLNRTLAGYDALFNSYTSTLKNLEEKIVDRNNQDSIAVAIFEMREYAQSTKNLIDEVKSSMLSKESVAIMENNILEIQKCVVEMKDKKKNASWWVDWLYKIFLTIALIANFFL